MVSKKSSAIVRARKRGEEELMCDVIGTPEAETDIGSIILSGEIHRAPRSPYRLVGRKSPPGRDCLRQLW